MSKWINNTGKQPTQDSVPIVVKYEDGNIQAGYRANDFDWDEGITNAITDWMYQDDYDAFIAGETMAGIPKIAEGFVTKDSGKRIAFAGGMQRDTNEGKPRFELLLPEGVPYNEQIMVRFAELMGRGTVKYKSRNWEKASGHEELDRFKESAFRHFIQWQCNEQDEDHAVAVMFNIMGYETTKWKMEH